MNRYQRLHVLDLWILKDTVVILHGRVPDARRFQACAPVLIVLRHEPFGDQAGDLVLAAPGILVRESSEFRQFDCFRHRCKGRK